MSRFAPVRRPSRARAFVAAVAIFAAAVATVVRPPTAAAAERVSQSRPIGPFKAVRLVGAADLVLTQADTPSLTVEGDPKDIDGLVAENRGDELVLRYEPRHRFAWWRSDRKGDDGPRFVLAAKTLERVSTAGTGDVRADAWTSPGDFEISVSGSSDVRIGALAARRLLVRISGSGEVTLAGGVLEQNVKISGSGDYRAGDLQSATTTIAIAGSGDATLAARDALSVSIAGSGDVQYYGHPTVTRSIAGVGSVTALGDKR